MSDISIVKFVGQSKITVEGYIGYFLINKDGDFKYDVLQYPLGFSSLMNISVKDDFKVIQRKIPQIRANMIQRSAQIKEMNKEVNLYIGRKVNSDSTFKHRFLLSIRNGDTEVLNSFVEEFFKEWVDPVKISAGIEEMSYSEFSKQLSKVGDTDEAFKVIKRNDLKDLSECYPIVDPVSGKSINDFNVGEKIYFTILRFANDQSKSEMLKKFPSDFNDQGENISPLIGRVISKEFVPEFGDDFTLIKIECQDVYFKALVLNSINLMSTSMKVPLIKNESIEIKQKKEETDEKEDFHVNFIDVIIAVLLVGGIVGTIATITYFFFIK